MQAITRQVSRWIVQRDELATRLSAALQANADASDALAKAQGDFEDGSDDSHLLVRLREQLHAARQQKEGTAAAEKGAQRACDRHEAQLEDELAIVQASLDRWVRRYAAERDEEFNKPTEAAADIAGQC